MKVIPLTSNEGDDVIDQLISDHPGFRKILEARLKGKFISTEQALRRINSRSAIRTR